MTTDKDVLIAELMDALRKIRNGTFVKAGAVGLNLNQKQTKS